MGQGGGQIYDGGAQRAKGVVGMAGLGRRARSKSSAFQPGGKVEGTAGDVQPGIDSNYEWRLNEEIRMC